MKFPAVAFVVLLSTFLTAQGQPAHSVVHADGTSASVFVFDNGSSLLLSVSRASNTVTGEQSTFLFFSSFTPTPDGFTSTFGEGSIPNHSLTGGNPAHLTLNVDTSQVTSFQATTCTFSFSDSSSTCTNAPGGLINIDWKQNGNFSTHSVGSTQQEFFQFTIDSHGESYQSSATVNGSVLGFPLSNASGNSGTNHNVTISLSRKH